ncbi:MAG: toll/interleukin-1 receptor domain-containing protein [bacterium]
MTHVFISYAREDRARAKRLAEALVARGLSVWWDREILAGQAFDDVIEAELERAKSVVVLWSKHSVVSDWVKGEATEARERGVLVPALIDAVKPPLEFRRKETVDLVGWEGEPAHAEFEALCRGISAQLAKELTPQPAPPATLDSPIKRRRSVFAFSWTGFALLILIGSALGYWDAFHRPHIEYYANVMKRWGLPEGIGRLTDEEVRHRAVSLAFHKRGRWGVVHEIRAVNSRGGYPPAFGYYSPSSFVDLNPLEREDSERFSLLRVSFTRGADGQVLTQTGYTRSDRPLYTLHYAQPDIAEYKQGAFSLAVRESGRV